MNKLYYSPEALADLDELWEYIYADLENPTAAANTVEGVLKSINKLADFAHAGPLLSSIMELESDYRFLVCGNYIAFYRVADRAVYVDRILYAKRDYMRILFEKPSEE